MAGTAKTKPMIVKVQIFASDRSILIYDRTRKYNGIIKDTTVIAMISERMEGNVKSYFVAEYTQTPICFELIEKVEDQNW